ncbi:tRNA pseudouridine(55) synthase TruB [Dinghuibacter silviterrae]|uniref:tRNA pseudouridine synthase B n=1 Tax=Dinghuibacter silviterrae TaxID=1539049 RepID=A0A4R8DRT3_9BACT|nr:tRNA pseudouridine(55) synthase TruB [Dinghuibacter silviterrae]TDX00932.1 tRNA pseudouridine synthase B [Dinghuibacter silviterrae]
MKELTQLQQLFTEGKVLLLDKPLEWTSFDVVAKIRNVIKIKKVGHAGTLDPLATGLLIVCTGKYTKRINEYMGQEKEYLATFTLGARTPTYDLESEPEAVASPQNVTEEDCRRVALSFTGDIMQVPPAHSAIKQGGKPVYLKARKGHDVQLEPRPVTIKAFDILALRLPEVDVRVVCTTGTYIRSLAHDFGAALGCGAYLSKLRRTRIGDFRVEEAQTVDAFVAEVRAAQNE